MQKINNFKLYFSQILEKEYNMTKKDILKYWQNKEQEEKFDNRKFIGTMVGFGELVTSATLCVLVPEKNPNVLIPIIIFGGIGALTTKIAVSIKNPYYLTKYKEIDKTYHLEKGKYKKRYK